MQDEIFGPILPVIEYDETQAIAIINQRPKPLALYLFSRDKIFRTEFCRKPHLAAFVSTTVLCRLLSHLYHLAALVIAALVAITVKLVLIPSPITKCVEQIFPARPQLAICSI